MRISILSPDLSQNCLGRAYLLAELLKKNYEVEIVGPIFGKGIWEAISNKNDIKFKTIKFKGRFSPYLQVKELAKNIKGDVIYASKPLLTSFGVGLFMKIFKRKPLVLDIEDWQMGFIKEIHKKLFMPSNFKYLVTSFLYLYNAQSYWNNIIGERLVCFAEEITVSNRFLHHKFGGKIICHARDTEVFNPYKYSGSLIKKRYGINKNKIVMFFGTPRPHKGIEDLIKAVNLIRSKDIALVIVGIDESSYCKDIVKLGEEILADKFIELPMQLFERVPEILAMSDIVVIPQRNNFASIGQIPAKIIDAMAMAKPIVSTNVSDIPEILEGCGWVVEPGNPFHLAQAIKYIFDDPKEAKRRGNQARIKCINRFSYNVVGKKLIDIFSKYER